MANGKFAGGDGTEQNPFLIEDAFDLDAVRNGLGKCYKLVKDIDLNVAPFNTGEGWIPIGAVTSTADRSNMFKGNFDGNGYNIKNLYINKPTIDYLALFSSVYNSIIKNTGIININISGKNTVSGLISYSGGVSEIKNCYTSGAINGDTGVSGLIGEIDHSSKITNCYSSCIVKGNSKKGGLVATKYGGSINNSYWDKETSGQTISAGGEGKTTAEMKTPSTFVDWDKEKLEDGTPIWVLKDGEYPRLWFEKPPIITKFLINKDDKYYTLNPNLTEVPTLDYEKYGFDSEMLDKAINDKTFTPTPGTQVLTADGIARQYDLIKYDTNLIQAISNKILCDTKRIVVDKSNYIVPLDTCRGVIKDYKSNVDTSIKTKSNMSFKADTKLIQAVNKIIYADTIIKMGSGYKNIVKMSFRI